ncbi:MAG: glycosyltransferase, partial [Chitinophagaceae bacterium]
MKVSIITACYNSAATVRDTLQSVAEQDYPEVEHIIIDGKSSDDTLRVLCDFPHVGTVVSEKDSGIYDAMNKGVRHATGDIVGILNSDDLYTSSNVISRVMKEFEDDSVDAVYADLQYVKFHDTSKVVRTWRSGGFSKSKFYYGWMPPHPTFFVRRQVYEQVGNFNLSLRSAADYEFMLRVLLK